MKALSLARPSGRWFWEICCHRTGNTHSSQVCGVVWPFVAGMWVRWQISGRQRSEYVGRWHFTGVGLRMCRCGNFVSIRLIQLTAVTAAERCIILSSDSRVCSSLSAETTIGEWSTAPRFQHFAAYLLTVTVTHLVARTFNHRGSAAAGCI